MSTRGLGINLSNLVYSCSLNDERKCNSYSNPNSSQSSIIGCTPTFLIRNNVKIYPTIDINQGLPYITHRSETPSIMVLVTLINQPQIKIIRHIFHNQHNYNSNPFFKPINTQSWAISQSLGMM